MAGRQEGRLAQPELHVAELVAGTLELGREPLERRNGALRELQSVAMGHAGEGGQNKAFLFRAGGEFIGGQEQRGTAPRGVTIVLYIGSYSGG